MSKSNRPGHASEPANEAERFDEHLDDVDDGCGCAEIWEHLSERRSAD